MCPGVRAQPDELSQKAFILGLCIPVGLGPNACNIFKFLLNCFPNHLLHD